MGVPNWPLIFLRNSKPLMVGKFKSQRIMWTGPIPAKRFSWLRYSIASAAVATQYRVTRGAASLNAASNNFASASESSMRRIWNRARNPIGYYVYTSGENGRRTRSSGEVAPPLMRCLTYFPCFLRFAAQYAFMRSDCSLRAAADIPPLRFLAGADWGATAAADKVLRGPPRLLIGPWRASIARLSLSRSATSSARMFSVIRGDRSTNFSQPEPANALEPVTYAVHPRIPSLLTLDLVQSWVWAPSAKALLFEKFTSRER